jgi:hypothetical protein
MSVKLTMLDQMTVVAREQRKTLAPLHEDLALLDSGIDSFGIAALLARLEISLRTDPFTTRACSVSGDGRRLHQGL